MMRSVQPLLARFVPDIDDERGIAWLWRACVLVLVAGLLACAGESGSTPPDPELLPPGETQGPVTSSSTTVTQIPLAGFGDVVVEIHRVDGQILEWCLLLAETPEQRERGLMHVTDPGLDGHDGMLFRYAEDSDVGFWMRNTPQPLAIAYVDAGGQLISVAEATPCEDSRDCPGYPPGAPYRWVVEAPLSVGGVERLGLVPGATLVDTGRACQ